MLAWKDDGVACDNTLQLAKGDDGARKGDGADHDANSHFNPAGQL